MEAAARELRPRDAGRRGQAGAADVREVHPAALEQMPFLDQAARAAAAFGPLPCVAAERQPVELLESGDDARLQVQIVVFD